MSRPSCTAIIIYPPHTRYLSMLLHGAKEYSNSSSRINKHIFAEFSSAVSRKERDRGNWLRLWKLVNHDGAPPVKIGKRGAKPVSRKQLFLSDEGNDDGRARCWKTPFVAFPSRFPGKEKGPRAGEREVG